MNLFESHIDNTVEAMRNKQFKEPIPMPVNSFVASLCNLMEGVLSSILELKQFPEER